MARIYDNIELKFEKGLKDMITTQGVVRTDFCVGYFNLRGWNRIVDEIDHLEGDYVEEEDGQHFRICRLLIGMQRPDEELIRSMYPHKDELPDDNFISKCKKKIATQFRRQLQWGLPSKQDEWTLRRLVSQMKNEKVCVKLYLREPLHAKLYLAHRPKDHMHPIEAIMGSSNLTFPGLTKQGELNAEFGDSDNARKLSDWFNDRWDDRRCIDITNDLVDAIESSWAGEQKIKPYYIYLKTAYYLSQEARSGINEYVLDPVFKKELFPFQENAVKIAAKHLMNDKIKGAMIGDVVGLGKTITACAIAKIFEDHMSGSTLIICPANLQKMWQRYINKYDLKAMVMSNAQPIDIETQRYFRLVIIDESHNLRNPQGARYQNIKKFIESQDNSVLLLTATPYNKDYRDLSSQLKLFISEDQDLGIRPEVEIQDEGGDNQFKHNHSDVFMRCIKAFELSDHVEDWTELMKLFMVRRTRTFIKENYTKTDNGNGRKYLEFHDGTKSYFPERIPKAIKYKTEKGDQFYRLYSEEMLHYMSELELPRYGLSQYVKDDMTKDAPKYDLQLLDNLSRAGRRMMGFCRSTFFKRMDSSGLAFLLTIYRHILRNCVFIYAIDNKLSLPVGDENQIPEDYVDDIDINNIFGGEAASEPAVTDSDILDVPTDMDFYMKKAQEYYQYISSKNNVAWIHPKYFKRTLKQKLNKDCKVLIQMIQYCGAWNPAADSKLNQLEDLVNNRHKEDKVIVFTQFSDTAKYIYRQLKRRGITQIDIATGESTDPTTSVEKFSPVSNGETDMPETDQTRILIATDVLSEGQNLQDAHVIVNFDLPWAIIRLIQRAGRVDRIGQDADKIFCYSFFPADEVEHIIHLRERLNRRINEAANVVGSDEVFFEGNEKNLTDLYNEKAGALDDEEDNDVDLASLAYEIWNQAVKANPKLKDIIPHLNDMVYSTKTTDDRFRDGVITYVRTRGGFDLLSWYNSKGELISQSQKKILKAMECSINEPAAEPLENHHDLVSQAVQNIQINGNTNVSGMLGSRFSTRYRIVTLLENYYQRPADLFFSNTEKQLLKETIDDIYNYPFLDTVKTMLGRMLRMKNLSHDEIVTYVLELYKNNELVHKEDEDNKPEEHKIICSMGLKYSED